MADDLEMVLNGAKKQYRSSMPTMKTVVAQNTDKEARLVEIVYPDKYLDDVILPQEKVLQLEEVIREFQNWDILISNGVAPINKLLFMDRLVAEKRYVQVSLLQKSEYR